VSKGWDFPQGGREGFTGASEGWEGAIGESEGCDGPQRKGSALRTSLRTSLTDQFLLFL